MTQMKEQSRQIITLINVVTQLVSSTAKLKRKLIVMFSFSEDLTITNTQHVSSKRVVKLTKRAQITRIETVRIKRAKIHESSIESLFSLNFETTHDAELRRKHEYFSDDVVDCCSTKMLELIYMKILSFDKTKAILSELFENSLVYDTSRVMFSRDCMLFVSKSNS